jgi:hypothetical protein
MLMVGKDEVSHSLANFWELLQILCLQCSAVDLALNPPNGRQIPKSSAIEWTHPLRQFLWKPPSSP